MVGNPGAGKSSLLESLRREGFFKSFQRVSESSVPPHTAGIIPTTFYCKHYGRVLLYDFAGDPEYYSSHAAILENLASSSKGDNIFITVVDLRDDDATIDSILHYWVSFIQQQKFTNATLGIVGSHSNRLSKGLVQRKLQTLEHFLKSTSVTKNISTLGSSCLGLDCCKPRSDWIDSLQKQILSHTKNSVKHTLSEPASWLLGLLEHDFTLKIQGCVYHMTPKVFTQS